MINIYLNQKEKSQDILFKKKTEKTPNPLITKVRRRKLQTKVVFLIVSIVDVVFVFCVCFYFYLWVSSSTLSLSLYDHNNFINNKNYIT